ncbi:MAG: hypothetical protein FWG91_02335 [Lachnospiraceae bacterium]|nr:hypothetical protein [Lachnospiraceae bacterium]
MASRLTKHKLFFLSAGLIFFLICQYYILVDPILLRNGDDWRYFGSFLSEPVPRIGWWNVTRLFQEHLMPIVGYQSAFFIYPLVGDYLTTASIALAIVIAFFITGLFFAIYLLFSSLCKNKNTSALISVMIMALFFAFFKGRALDNVHMFFASQYNLYFYYIFPNIINSAVALFLMKQLILKKNLAFSSKSGWLLAGIYFSIFSMLFSAGILLAFASAVLIFRFFVNFGAEGNLSLMARSRNFFTECVKQYNIAIAIIFGVLIAMVLETTSLRSKEILPDSYFGSIVDIEFLNRIGVAANNFFSLARSINKYIFAIIALIYLIVGIHYLLKKEAGKPDILLSLPIKCLISAAMLPFFYIVLSAKAGTHYAGEIRCVYGAFFFIILSVGFLSLYILRELPISRLFAPLILSIILLVALNTRWPFQVLSPYDEYALVHKLIPALVEADNEKHTKIILYVPEYSPEEWELHCLSDTLFIHRVTFNKIDIVSIEYSTERCLSRDDNCVYYVEYK